MALVLKKHTTNDFRPQAWKNGQGETTELARDPRDPFAWRLSRAQISASTPFSLYPGYERVLLTLTHSTIWLFHVGGRRRLLPSFTPYRFSGDVETTVEIVEPVDDFNLICRAAWAKGNIYPTYYQLSREMQLPVAGQEHFIYCVEGSIDILEPSSGVRVTITKGELLQITRPDKVEYLNLKTESADPSTIALWVIVHLLK